MKRSLITLQWIWVLTLAISACTTAPKIVGLQRVNNLLADDIFVGFDEIDIESEQEIFELRPDILAKVQLRTNASQSPKTQLNLLVSQIIGKPNSDILYSPLADLTASQTYESKSANCLSLSIMAYALAQAAGIDAQFQRVLIPEIWTQQNNFTLINGHVNVKLTAKQYLNHLRIAPFTEYSRVYSNTDSYSETLDFSPELARQPFKKEQVSKQTIQAFFYNNKAAQALINGDNLLAYRYLSSALKLEPNDAGAWTNLGLLYKRKSLLTLAEQAFNYAIELEPEKLSTFDNLIVLYKDTGRADLAEKVESKLEIKRRDNPYYQALKGQTAYEHGDMNEAIRRYKKAIFLNSEEYEFYWGVAKSYFELGDLDSTQKYLTRAKSAATFEDVSKRYQSKLDALKHLTYNLD